MLWRTEGDANEAFAPRDRTAYERLRALKEQIRQAHQRYPDRVRLMDNYKVCSRWSNLSFSIIFSLFYFFL